MITRLLRIIKHRWALFTNKAEIVYDSPWWLSDAIANRAMTRNEIPNLIYSKKHRSHVVVMLPMYKNKDNN